MKKRAPKEQDVPEREPLTAKLGDAFGDDPEALLRKDPAFEDPLPALLGERGATPLSAVIARSGAAQLCFPPLYADNVVPLRLAERFDNLSRRRITGPIPRLSREMPLQFVRPEPVAMPREYFVARDAQFPKA